MIPTKSSQDDSIKIYKADALNGIEQHKFEEFIEAFEQRTQLTPDYVILAPGRVNLIGDHIDYHGFSVLPMAIKKYIWLGLKLIDNSDKSSRPHSIELLNRESQSFPDWLGSHSFAYGSSLGKSHKWHHYVLCGYHGILATRLLNIEASMIQRHAIQLSSSITELRLADDKMTSLDNIIAFVDSDLPIASGLSSSSALVCASAVATSLMLKPKINQFNCENELLCSRELASCCSMFEHLIGTHGGGMDQAVIMTAQQGYAKYVQFVPELKCENVHLPDNIAWLVSHCGVSYHKAATSGFNSRVLETKLGAALIAKSFKAEVGIELNSSITLSSIKDRFFKSFSCQDIVAYLRKSVFNECKDEYTVDEICSRLELSRIELIERFDTTDKFLSTELKDRLKLQSRCEHVFEEAERVEKFRSICETTTDIGLLGQLMTQSHHSLRDKYDCSHPALDRLVDVALDAGALGSRLTGAGWGGCTVTLVEISRCDTVFKRLKEVSNFTFRTEPQSGCQVVRMRI